MTTGPLVSILTTAYNRDRYIAEAIESVLRSSYQNWELIISDDCSTDNTVSIANSYAEKDSRIKVYLNDKNLGDYPNRNKAASYAKGIYLKYLDSDDTILPHALEQMVQYMQRFPKAGWAISNFLPGIDESELPVCLDNKQAYEFHYFQQPIFFASPGLTLISKAAFEAVGGFGEKRMVSDFDMWHKLSAYAPVVLVPGNMVFMREHAEHEVKDRDKYAVAYEKVKLKHLHDANCPLTTEQVAAIIKQRRNTTMKIAARKLMKLDIKEAKPRLQVFWFYVRNG